MNTKKVFYKGPLMVVYIINKLNEFYPNKSIGKTAIQKLTYLFVRKLNDPNHILNYDFSLHYYGPYSDELSSTIDFAESKGLIDIRWEDKKGYIIQSRREQFEELEENEKELLDEVVQEYGNYGRVIDISIVATAFYVKDKYDVPDDELPASIENLKPELDLDYIKKVLLKYGITK